MSAGAQDHAANIDPNKLELLLQQFGIEREFIQFSGVIAHIPLANRLHILDTMGVAVDSSEQIDSLLDTRELASAARMVPPVVYRDPGQTELEIFIPAEFADTETSWSVESETGELLVGRILPKDLRILREFTTSGRHYY